MREHVDLKAGRILIFRRKTSKGLWIPVFPQLRPLIEKLCADKTPTEHLFSVQAAHRALTAACQRLGFSHFTHRSLRRMFITRAIERGLEVKVISQWQGHQDGGVLIYLRTYSHVRIEHAERMQPYSRPSNRRT